MGDHTFLIETGATTAGTDLLDELLELAENHEDVGYIRRAEDFHEPIDRHLLGDPDRR